MMSQISENGELTGSIMERRLHVDPVAGIVCYKSNTKKYGDRLLPTGWIKPGSASDGGGYRMINVTISHRKYAKIRAHHLIWMWVHGCWPTGEIDHINGVRDDNRIENLREVSVQENRCNVAKHKDNRSGYKWVSFHSQSGKWHARIFRNGKYLLNSLHSSPEEAYAAARNVAEKFHGALKIRK